MIRATDIHALTDFQRNARAYIQQVKATKNPTAITVNDEAEVVVQDAGDYQRMVDELQRARFSEAIREGLKDVDEGRTRPAEEVLAEIKAKYGL